MSSNTKTLTALLIGAAAGAVLGVLFAPDRGDKTRDKLKKFAKSTGEDLKGYVDQGVTYAKRTVEAGKEQVNKFANDVHGKANEVASRAEDLTDKLKSEVKDVKTGAKPNMY